MKNKYNIGDIVFIIKDNDIIEEKIKSIIKEDNKYKYVFDENICGGTNENEIFSSKNKAILKFSELLQKAKFKIGDIVFVLEQNCFQKINKLDIINIDRIKDVQLDSEKKIEYILYKEYASHYGNTTQIISENRLIKFKKKLSKNFFKVGDLIEQLNIMEKKHKEILIDLEKEKDISKDYLDRKFVKRCNELNSTFLRKLYKELFEQEELK